MTFQVEAEDLTAHASHLEALTDRVDTAISAAEQVSMDDEAYGLLCSFLPPIINPMEEEGLNALKAAKEGITTTADNVRQTAKEYQETDEAGADNFSQFDDAVRVNDSAVALRGVESTGSSSSPSGSTSASYEPAMQGRPASGPVMDSEPRQFTAMNAPEGRQLAEPQHAPMEPKQFTPMNAPEGRQQVEPQHAPMEPKQFTPMNAPEGRQRVEPFEQAEPMERDVVQATPVEPAQRPTATYQGDLYSS
ncbi:type VII secretion target [Saccharopolyspora sp. WRP15-2]|uniref:Type VII secretion target n=1 Tax=Saccharopolyspora oryzae TaxID=2997343 RepID=A0ABT4V1D5_9PSEU|nr:type VII secretion target [Saccharopolyspora oryzae]MDA3627776.1 type VII secretion target [Saccharopolyspora oryzae]